MVSKANDDLPLPLIPVMTTSWLRGRLTLIFLRLCSRAPMTSMNSCPVRSSNFFSGADFDMKWGRGQGASKNTKMRGERFGGEFFSGEELFPEELFPADRADLRRILR